MNLVKEFLKNRYSHLTEMAKVGHFGDYIIEMFSNEGPIPHFHFINVHNNKINGCICLQENRYFNHGCHTAILNSKERKLLIEFLNQKMIKDISNYEYLCRRWNILNVKYRFDFKDIPDYMEIKEWI